MRNFKNYKNILSSFILFTLIVCTVLVVNQKDTKVYASTNTNIALNRAAYASSTANFNDTAHLTTDGFESTKWLSKDNDEQWIYVDLGEVCEVNSVKLHWTSLYATSYKLQASNNINSNGDWTDLYSTTTGDGDIDEISFSTANARYIRMYATTSLANNGYCITEFEIYGIKDNYPTTKPSPEPESDGTLYLTGGNWKVQNASFVQQDGQNIASSNYDDSSWIIATVPGTVLTSYLNIGAIPDPYYADQQLQISESFFTYNDFWYRNSFEIPLSYEGKKVWLNFDGINWKADIFVNGTQAGSINGAYTRAKFDVTDLVNVGETNYLAILIHKVDNPNPVKVKKYNQNCFNGGKLTADSPTVLCSLGWDWIPTIRGRNIGIYNNVFLSKTGDISIVDPYVKTDLPLPSTSSADIAISTELHNNSSKYITGILKGSIGDITFSYDVTLDPFEKKQINLDKSIFSQLTINNPKLWWPNTYGTQNLYTLNLEFEADNIISDTKDVKFGIREYTYDDSNNILKISCNGVRIFVRGGNWGLSEAMLRETDESLDIKVRLHKEMNMNMIRNWVGQTDFEGFYTACDKYGIMIWDDFWLANPYDGPNPNDNDMFLTNAEDKIRKIRNHPSVAIYCGRNEGYPPSAIDTGLRNAIKQLDGTRYYSPASSKGVVTGEGPYNVQDPKNMFAAKGTTFHTELGMHSTINIESYKNFMPDEFLWPMNDMWGIHDYFDHNPIAYGTTTGDRYGTIQGIEDFCRKGQLLNMETHKNSFEVWASKGGPGLLGWMSMPAWPSLIWQTFDYYYEPTASFFAIKKACEPTHILWDCNTNQIKVTNNTTTNYTQLNAEAWIYNMDGTQQTYQSDFINVDSVGISDCFTLEFPSNLSNVHFIKLKLTDSNDNIISDNFYWRGNTWLQYEDINNMPTVNLEPTVTQSINGSTCTLTSTIDNNTDSIALMARLKVVRNESEERVLPIYYEDNYFSLLPGETKVVNISFDTKYLEGEQPKLILEGWNINRKLSIPTGLKGKPVSDSQIEVSWNESFGTTSYDLMVDDILIENVAIPYLHTGLDKNSTHTYQVRAKNNAETSDWSSRISTTTYGNVSYNLASNKEVTANSCMPSEPATKAVDGIISNNSKWCSTTDIGEQWLMVDLGNDYDINRWVVKHAGSGGEDSIYNTKDFKLQKSIDGVTFTDVDSVTGNTSNITDRTVSPFNARYLRLYITNPQHSTNWLAARIYEVEVYGN